MTRQPRDTVRHAARISCALLAILALGACARDDAALAEDGAATTTRDSAGITILEHHLADAPAWTLSPQPLLRIGTVSGDSAQELYRVRAAGFLRGGRLAVAVDGSHELRVYDSTGALTRRIGREGGGPGEFRNIRAMWTIGGDSLAVYDGRTHRVTIFDDTGAVLRSSNLPVLADSLHGGLLTGIFGLLGGHRPVGFTRDTGGMESGLQRPLGSILVFDGSGEVVGRAGRAPAQEVFLGKPVNTPQGPMVPFSTSPFTRTTLLAVGRDRIYVADNARYDVRVVSPDGELRTLLRADVPSLSIGDEDFRRIADSSLRAIGHPEAATQMIGAIREATPFDTMPALASLAVDADDRLWVEERARPGAPSRRIAVYDARGALVSTLALPSPLRLLGAAGDRVIVLRRGESDEEYVEEYGLVRPE